jgi:hypothetical protein
MRSSFPGALSRLANESKSKVLILHLFAENRMVRNEHNSTASLWRLTRFSLMNALLMMTVVALAVVSSCGLHERIALTRSGE